MFFLVITSVTAQSLEDIPDQFTETNQYDILNLNDYITGSTCYEFDINPSNIASTGQAGHPNLSNSEYEDARENMTVTMKINYAGFNLGQHPEDAIWVYDNQDNLAEVNDSYVDPFNPDEHIFYLNVRGNFDNYLARVIFYSGVLDTTFEYFDVFEYGHNKVLGTVLEPFVIDEAPLFFNFDDEENTISANIVNSNYAGDICLDVIAFDCEGEEIGTDQVCYKLGQDPCSNHVTVSQELLAAELSQLFLAKFSINSAGVIEEDQVIEFSAGESVCLMPGFEVKQGAEFTVDNVGCQ